MKQSTSERVMELKKHLDNRPSMCKHCKSKTDNGNMEYICGRTERHTFFGIKADKCNGDCELYEKSFPEMLEDTIYGILKSQIEKLKANSANNETEGNAELFESGYLQCQKDVLEIIEKLSDLRRNKKMKQFLKFLTKIKSFWKFYQNYGYDGEDVEFIIENYQDVLQNRTKLMSKPTYYANDVIKQIDEWYYEEYEPFRIWRTDNKFENKIEFSVEYSDLVNSDELVDIVIEKNQKRGINP